MAVAVNAVYSRVTVVNGTRRVDLALPAAVPLAEVMPQLLRYCAPDESPGEPRAWTLGRLGEANLSLARSIADAAVADGEVLELRTAQSAAHPAYVEDVRDTIEDAVDESGRRWESRTTVGFTLCTAAFGLAAALLLPEARQQPVAWGMAAIVAAVALLGAWWAARRGHRFAGWALTTAGVLWGGATGWFASALAGWPWPASLACALTAALVTAAVARSLTHLATVGVWCAASLPIGLFALSGMDPMQAVRIVAVLTILAIGVLPRVSLTVGGIANADYRVRNVGQVSGDELARRIRTSDVLLHGSLLAISVAGVVIGLLLTGSAVWWDRWLGLAMGLGLLSRSRVFSRIPHLLPLRLAGVMVLIGQSLRFMREDTHAGAWLIAIAPVAAAIAVAISAIPLSEIARARVKQLLNIAEIAVVAAMVPLAAGGLGLFAWMSALI